MKKIEQQNYKKKNVNNREYFQKRLQEAVNRGHVKDIERLTRVVALQRDVDKLMGRD